MRLLKIITLCVFLKISSAISEELAIVNISSDLPKVVSVADLRSYFLLKNYYYPNGIKVQVYLLDRNSLISRNFLLNVLNITPSSYYDMIESQVSTGRVNVPIIVESETKMIIAVAVNNGGLGLVRDSRFVSNIKRIKILEVK